MIKVENKQKCCGCFSCATVCAKKCITMKCDDEGFWYPEVDNNECIDCGMCEKVCPVLNKPALSGDPDAIAAVCKDEKTRAVSSSGGVFSIIATQIIKCGGVVFGAGFNEDFEVEHIAVEQDFELCKLQGSKYVQSRIGNAYGKAKEYLNEGRTVLFTGTPCQISGLKAYLQKKYDNLICVDIICHGVPSPSVWKRYITVRKEEFSSEIQRISFRDKTYGWKNFSMAMDFASGQKYVQPLSKDSYMQAFLRNLSLRPSCYDCSFKGVRRYSDITLADCWGAQNFIPDFDDDGGMSLVLINSPKGRELLGAVMCDLSAKNVDVNTAIKYNVAAVHSVEMPKKRSSFMKQIASKPFDKTVSNFSRREMVLIRLLKRIKNIIIKK